ncbi:hypothetical protein AgCh_013562 [Apium graveolens]
MVRHGSLVTLDEQIEDLTYDDEFTKQIKSEHETKLAARKIFKNVTRPRFKYIYMNDLARFLREDEAMKVMVIIAGSTEYDRISKKGCCPVKIQLFKGVGYNYINVSNK